MKRWRSIIRKATVEKDKRIVLLATGGTIAGLTNNDKPGYRAASLEIESLLESLPQTPSTLEARQVMNLDSRDMTPALMLALAKEAKAALSEASVCGVVITHGTDTLEESAFFLSRVISEDKPVVFTAAMRPADSLSGDGLMNLYQALLVAGSSRAKGVLTVLNDVIYSGAEIVKNNASQLQAFYSPFGPLGQVEEGRVHFFRLPLNCNPRFQLEKLSSLPDVPLLYGYAGMPPAQLQALLDADIKGLVYAAPGNGSVPEILYPLLLRASNKGMPIVLASRTGGGFVNACDKSFISAGWLNPLQARIMLQLGLSQGFSGQELCALFGYSDRT